MYDMLHLAFQTDNTRIATFMLAGDGSNRDFEEIGIPDGHHSFTHHRNKPDMIAKVPDRYLVCHAVRLLPREDGKHQGRGRQVAPDNSMIMYGCGNGDGNRHTHVNLPIILAGGGGGTLKSGRYVKHPSVPMTNLYLSIMDRMGAERVNRFADSTGRLKDI